MKIKYPRYHLTDHPSDFYTWYQEAEGSRAMWSGWIKGDTNLWHKINKAKKDEKNKLIKELSTKVN